MLNKLLNLRNWPLWCRFGIAGISIGAAFAIQIPGEIYFPGEPFLLFFILVILSTFVFGELVGIFACALSTYLSFYFFTPTGIFAIDSASDLVKIEVYALLTLISILCAAQLSRILADNQSTRLSLEEVAQSRTLLLQEMMHRVANNFAVVSALIQNKASSVDDAQSKLVLKDAVQQVAVMARLHRNLLGSSQCAAALDSERFLTDLAADLAGSMGEGRPVSIECHAVSVPLTIDQSVPLSLIVNELITNALKHAFPADRRGTVRVNFEKESDASLKLTVEDDGIGLSDRAEAKGMGQRLISLLVQQLGGQMESKSPDKGASFVVAFPYQRPSSQRPSPPPEHTIH